jgi:hypothetical protein
MKLNTSLVLIVATFISISSNCQMISKDKVEQIGLTSKEMSEEGNRY